MSNVNLRTLVLNNNYMPVSIFPNLFVIPAEDAIHRILGGSCDAVFYYDRPILTPSRSDLYWPSVIVNRNGKSFKKTVKLSKATLYYRDGGKCFWCERAMTIDEVTRDHVVPTSRGGNDTWDNVVCSCHDCNHEKGDHPPTGKWNPKNKKVYTPTFFDLLEIRKKHPLIVDSRDWLQFLPEWTGEVIVRGENRKGANENNAREPDFVSAAS